MTDREALEALGEAELIPLVQGPLAEVKRIWKQCLEQDVPVAIAAPSGPGCGTRLSLLVREEDVPKVAALLHRDWNDLLEREGVDLAGPGLGVEVAEGEEPPCPACGTAAPLEEGACKECGLQLE
jgi:hypothetical protein